MNKEEVFSALDRLENDALSSRDGYGDTRKDAAIIRAALTAKRSVSTAEAFTEFIPADLELLMKDLNSINLSAMIDKKTHWQDGGKFEDRVLEAARLYFMSRIKADGKTREVLDDWSYKNDQRKTGDGQIPTEQSSGIDTTGYIQRLEMLNKQLVGALKDLYDAVQSGGYPHSAMIRTKLVLDRAEQKGGE